MVRQERGSAPYPMTLELTVLGAAGVVLVLLLGVHTGRGVATFLAGGGWVWPASPQLLTSVPAVLAGDPTAGLGAASVTGVAPGRTSLWWCIGVVQVVVVAVVVLVGVVALQRWGPSRWKGTATAAEIERALGVSRLRKVRAVVRPDLHDKPDRGRTRRTSQLGAPAAPAGALSRLAMTKIRKATLACASSKRRLDPHDVGWPIGTAREPRGGALFVPWDRTGGVIGPQGSGKTLDVLVPALLCAPGAALVTLTKVEDLLLSLAARERRGPCVVLDPFGLATGLPELVWDPVAGCADPLVAERRAKAFTAGTVKGSAAPGDDAARFYAAEAAKVLQAYLHAAALTGHTIEDVLRWIAHPGAATQPSEILRQHPHAAPMWHGLLHGALHGDDRTAGNTRTTVQQAVSLFFQESIRRRCVPGPGRDATDVAEVIRAGGTIYLLGREDPYASASPLMTAVAEHVLDTALQVANTTPWGRLAPPMLACLDELPSTAPLPTLRTRMANERALGISFLWAAQTRRQLEAIYGEQEARALFALTNVTAVFGGSKDVAFNEEISKLTGMVRIARSSWQTGGLGGRGGRTIASETVPVLRAEDVRLIDERHALVLAENARPILTRLTRCIDGRAGADLLADQARARARIHAAQQHATPAAARTIAAQVEARRLGLHAQGGPR